MKCGSRRKLYHLLISHTITIDGASRSKFSSLFFCNLCTNTVGVKNLEFRGFLQQKKVISAYQGSKSFANKKNINTDTQVCSKLKCCLNGRIFLFLSRQVNHFFTFKPRLLTIFTLFCKKQYIENYTIHSDRAPLHVNKYTINISFNQ